MDSTGQQSQSTPAQKPTTTNSTPLASSSSSSPSPSITLSTMPSSVTQDKGTAEEADAMAVDSSSEVEILEERNGSPATSANAAGKRKMSDTKPTAEVKKAKLANASSSKSKAAKGDSPTTKKAAAKEKKEPSLVELKAGKFVLAQKALSWDATSSTMRGRLAFTDYVATLVTVKDAKLEDWPKEHWGVVGRLVHESDKPIATLTKHVKKQLVSYIDGSMAAQEDSQEAEAAEVVPTGDRIPDAPLESLIASLATRTNYGLDKSDLPNGLPDGVKDVPAGLQVWRWELHDSDLLPAELEAKLERRKAERVEAKSVALALFLELSESDQADLFTKPAPKKARTTKEAAEPVASGSGAVPKAAVKAAPKKKKVKEEVDDAEAEAKAKAKAEKEEEKEKKRIAREEANAEKEAKKAKKTQADAEKKEKEEKKKMVQNKQAALLSGFFIKKSQSPAPDAIAARAVTATPGRAKVSDFGRVFHPFSVKHDVTLAPTNRFRKARDGKLADVAFNSVPDLTAQDSIKAFLSGVPAHRIPHYNPHPSPVVSVRDTVRAINEGDLTGMDTSPYYKLLQSRSKVQIKFLKFKEDSRPGYIGTWTKTSRVVGPRTPHGKDTALIRYDYDSEDEWEEEPDDPEAEDVGSEGELSEDSDALSDDWLCEDDEVDYLPGHGEEDEMKMDVDGDSDILIIESDSAARKKVLDREKKAKAAKEAQRKKNAGPLLPLVLGPTWETKVGETTKAFKSMRIQFLNDAQFGLDPRTFKSKAFLIPSVPKAKLANAANAVASTSGTPTAATQPKPKAPPKPLPTHLMPRFVGLVQGSEETRPKLVEAIYEALKEFKVTKKMIGESMAQVGAVKEKKQWRVPAAVLAQYPSPMVID